MRVYIIGNDRITLCRKALTTVNDGEIAVASNEELRAAPLSGKRLLALWNALPGVQKRKKVGDRDALIDQLWSAIEMLPDPEPQPDPKRRSKLSILRGTEGSNPSRSTAESAANVPPSISSHERVTALKQRFGESRGDGRQDAAPRHRNRRGLESETTLFPAAAF